MFVFCFVVGVQAQENAAEDPIQTQDPIRLFITGNIHDKTAAVQQVSQTPESADTLSLMAIDYVLDYVPTLGADSDFLQLAQAAVAALGTPPAEQTVPRLNTLFRIFSDDTLRTAVLEKLSYYTQTKPAQTAGSVAIVNAFLTESLKPNATVGEAHLAAIRLLETAKSQSSFSVLFSYVLRGPNAQLSSAARDALNVLLPDGMQNIVRILTVNPSSEKLEIFNLVCENPQLSDAFKAETATNALEKTIYNTEDISWVDQELIRLHLEALGVLSELSWTKAAAAVMQLFNLCQKEYESGLLSDTQFSSVIEQTASLAADQASPVLISYLNALNKETEETGLCSEPVVLAVITALGELGDKAAFDYLLYVTYLDYPEPVIQAARNALAGLKW